MNSTTSKERAARSGEFTLAHSDYSKALNSYAFYKVSNHALSQDLVQDTFVKTWSYLVKNGKIDGMRAFLYHVLNNLIVDSYRKKKYMATSLDVLMDNGFSPSVDTTSALINVMDGKRAILLIKDLPLIYQNVMNMRYVQDLSLREISVITGQTENTVSVQVHRGVTKLKLLYNQI